MKFIRTIIIYIFCPFLLHAQENPAAYTLSDVYTLWNLSKADSTIVFADNAYVRNYPGLAGLVVDSIPVGTTVHLMSEALNGNTIKGFNAPWHHIRYIKQGLEKQAFIWQGLLALGHHKNTSGRTFLYGFDRYQESQDDQQAYYLCTVKLLDARGQLLSKESLRVDYSGQSFTESKLLPSMGLTGLQQIFRIAFLGEACGIPSNYYYLGWNGKAFISMPSRYDVGDAGIFYHTETILFPTEHLQENDLIYKLIEEGEVEDDKADASEYTIRKRKEKYRWNGAYFSQLFELN